MEDTFIITVYVIIADVLRAVGHRTDGRARTDDAEVCTVALLAAKYFQNNHDRALWVRRGMHYRSGPLSPARFTRRLHRLAPWLEGLLPLLAATFADEAVEVLDSRPVPVCRRGRAWRSRTLVGRAY